MKFKALLLALTIVAALSVGCTQKTAPAATPEGTAPEVVTTASLVNKEAAFEKAISKEGTWIIAALNDLTFDKELVLDGEFKNGKKDDAGKEIIQRKIALYTQDENRKVTARFTLTSLIHSLCKPPN